MAAPKHYRVDILVVATLDEEELALFVEELLDGGPFMVKDLTVYQVTHLPSYAEQKREAKR